MSAQIKIKDAVAPRRAKAKQEKHMPGEEGVWVFILGDMTVFALFFGTIIWLYADDPKLFISSQAHLNQTFGAVNTVLLLSSSLMVAFGVHSIRKGYREWAPRLFAGAFLCGVGFAIVKYFEYSGKIDHNLVPSTNDFWMYYFIFTGIHLFHLLCGLGVLTFLIYLSRKNRPGERDMTYIEGGASFWHMVDLLWIVLFPLFYLIH